MTYSVTPFRSESEITIGHVGFITKKNDIRPETFATALTEWLELRGIHVSHNAITPTLDLIMVLGGDGTLLHIAETAARHSIPVLGINMGKLGFLTDLTENETLPTLEKMLSSRKVIIENRMMLRTRLLTDDTATDYRYALNDIVITRNVLDRLLNLSTVVDHQYITTYRADGLIFSSPTGSTAYNLSAGGPLVYPGLATITVTPICPFMLSSRPIILPADQRITTKYEANDANERAQIIIDGQPFWEMKNGDRLEVETANHFLQLVVSSTRDYFTILRNKLHWGYQNVNHT